MPFALSSCCSAHIGELRQRVRVAVPTRIEGQEIALERALEQTDDGAAVLEDQPVLRLIAAPDGEAQLLVKHARYGDVLDGETDGLPSCMMDSPMRG